MSNQSGSGGSGNTGNRPKKDNPNVSDMILGGMKSRAGKETSSWLSNMAGKESVKDHIEQEANAVQARQTGPAPTGKNSIVAWFDKIFDNFAQYEVEFNRAVSGTELAVSAERPDYSNAELFRGKLSTREWALVLRNKSGIIEGFFVPSDKMIAFSINDKSFTRILQMKPGMSDDEPCFLVGDRGTPVLYSQLPYFSKQLFGALIRVAKGEGSDQEEFIWMPPSAMPERQPTSKEFDAARTADSPMPAVPASMRASSSHALLGQPQAAPNAYVQPRPLDGDSGFASEPMTLSAAFDAVLRAMEFELENLAQVGAQAFEDKDQMRVDAVMKRTNKVKAYRERLRGAITEWKSILAAED